MHKNYIVFRCIKGSWFIISTCTVYKIHVNNYTHYYICFVYYFYPLMETSPLTNKAFIFKIKTSHDKDKGGGDEQEWHRLTVFAVFFSSLTISFCHQVSYSLVQSKVNISSLMFINWSLKIISCRRALCKHIFRIESFWYGR